MSRPSWLLPIEATRQSPGDRVRSRAGRRSVRGSGGSGRRRERAWRGRGSSGSAQCPAPPRDGVKLRDEGRLALPAVKAGSPPGFPGDRHRASMRDGSHADVRIPYICTVSARMLPAYAELHCLSNFTFLRGASHPEELVRARRWRSATRRLPSPTNARSPASSARISPRRTAGLPLVVGSEFTLDDGARLALYATDRASYGDLAQLITRGRRKRRRAATAVARRRRGAGAALPRAVAPRRGRGERRRRAGSPTSFAGRAAGSRVGSARPRRRRCAARTRSPRSAARMRPAARRPRATCTCTCGARRALQDTLTAIRLARRWPRCGHAL